VFERLRDWRRAVAREAGVPAYVVFTDATLTAIAEREPASTAQLATISGVGKRKLDLYGEQVLAILRGSEVENVLQSPAGTDELV
jgi:DNA helicase-2/ATP-dependent DNA helicase PcrA